MIHLFKHKETTITDAANTDYPLVYFGGKIEVIDNEKQVQKAVEYLAAQEIIGFDTETKPTFFRGAHGAHSVALLQLSSDKRAYLFRLNKIGLPLSVVSILANKEIVKIGAAVHEDLRQLKALCPFCPEGFIDLQRIVHHYGIEEKSVRKMAARVLQIHISKNQQLSNWENDELTKSQSLYAATDAWVCREIFLKLQKIKPLTAAELQGH